MRVGRRRFSLLPVAQIAQSKLLRRPSPSLHEVAARTWEVAPASVGRCRAAHFLPGQIERITGWEFIDEHPGPRLVGGVEVRHAPTRASLLEGAWLLDGVVHHGPACEYLRPRTRRLPRLEAETTIERGALFASPTGNRWFGMWLLDDCPRYLLAEREGVPIGVGARASGHEPDYARLLRMRPRHVDAAYFRELVVFDDVGQNDGKRDRVRRLSRLLRAGLPEAPRRHPGVVLLRGLAGDRRFAEEERDIAETLARTRGFRIIDPLREDVATIAGACAGARCVLGVEGSQLAHAVLALAPGSCILTLQPPGRFVTVYKDIADRDGHHFGFVVGRPRGQDFSIDRDEVERTLDLFPPP